jgi:hypothetical protein
MRDSRQYIYWKKSTFRGLAQEIGISAPNSSMVGKGRTQLCTSKEECTKLDLIAAEYF